MIIARITAKGQQLFHGSVEIVGSPAGEKYREGGWFPVESFDFGLEASKDEKTDKPKPQAPPTGRPAVTNNAKKDASGSSKDQASVTLKKDVDMATAELMVLAMKDRSHKASKEREAKESEFWADIHVLGSVSYKDSKERYVYPSLMIHLEVVKVTQWKINGSGNARPTEDVTLAYQKGAMIYTWTDDGKRFFPSKAAGWDQDKHERWPSPAGDDGQFLSDSSSAPPFFKDFLPKF